MIKAFPASYQSVLPAICRKVSDTAKIWSPMLGVMSEAFPASVYQNTNEEIEDMAITWMKLQLVEMSSFCGVREKMSDWQLKAACVQMLEEYPETTMVEFILFCARLRSGAYESFYGNIDPMLILRSFVAFQKDKKNDYEDVYEAELNAKKEKEDEEARKNALPYEEVCKRMENGEYPNLKKIVDGHRIAEAIVSKMTAWKNKKGKGK